MLKKRAISIHMNFEPPFHVFEVEFLNFFSVTENQRYKMKLLIIFHTFYRFSGFGLAMMDQSVGRDMLFYMYSD